MTKDTARKMMNRGLHLWESGNRAEGNAIWLEGCNLFLMLNNAERRERGEFFVELA